MNTTLELPMQIERRAGFAAPNCSAVLSPCGLYRYELCRRWSDAPACVFIGLNPSTADERRDDPTIRRCVGYAKRWGFGSLCMLNLFAFRATLPKHMKAAKDPIGPENDATLKRLAAAGGIVIAAWGNHGQHMHRAEVVSAMLDNLHCLNQNKDGSPTHPLYKSVYAMPQKYHHKFE